MIQYLLSSGNNLMLCLALNCILMVCLEIIGGILKHIWVVLQSNDDVGFKICLESVMF